MKVHDKLFSRNARDAHEKMRGCIVWALGEWWMLHNYHSDWVVEAINLSRVNGKIQSEMFDLSKIDETDFRIGPFTLGMTNTEGGVYFLSRRPVRRNKFGLREENCDSVFVGGNQIDTRLYRVFGHVYDTGALVNTLNGVYPSFVKAIDSIQDGPGTAVAFNRAFAVERVGLRVAVLKYRTATIGEVDLRSKDIELYPAFDHMAERCKTIYGCKSVSVFKE